MQVDPIKPTLKAPGIKHLKLNSDEPLSKFAFEFNLRRFNTVFSSVPVVDAAGTPYADTQAGVDTRLAMIMGVGLGRRCSLSHMLPFNSI